MSIILKIALGFIVVCALLGYFLSSDDKPEESAMAAAVAGFSFILSLAPTIIGIVLVVLCVKSCT